MVLFLFGGRNRVSVVVASLGGKSIDDLRIGWTKFFRGLSGKLLDDVDIRSKVGREIVVKDGLSNKRSRDTGTILSVIIRRVTINGIILGILKGERLKGCYVGDSLGCRDSRGRMNIILKAFILGFLIHLKRKG